LCRFNPSIDCSSIGSKFVKKNTLFCPTLTLYQYLIIIIQNKTGFTTNASVKIEQIIETIRQATGTSNTVDEKHKKINIIPKTTLVTYMK
jgi:hypothetical protein